MGADFLRLHPTVQRFHRTAGYLKLDGTVRCTKAEHWLGRVLSWTLGTPQQNIEGPLTVEVDASPLSERWVRHFPGCTMASTLSYNAGEVIEKLGMATLYFSLHEDNKDLVMRLKRLRFFGIGCPKMLLPRIVARERGDKGRFVFQVEASVLGIGRVVSYSGYLQMEDF